MSEIVLASSSPRRKELLGWLGVEFEVVESNFDEESIREEEPVELAEALAVAKAQKVLASGVAEGKVIVAGDTVVGVEEGGGWRLIGKPKDEADAKEILRYLAGKTHVVVTGVCVIDELGERVLVESDLTKVGFRQLSEDEIDTYVKSGEPMGKAGGYAIQGGASEFVVAVEGSFTNVVGLPLVKLVAMLEEVGVRVEVRVEDVIYAQTGFVS